MLTRKGDMGAWRGYNNEDHIDKFFNSSSSFKIYEGCKAFQFQNFKLRFNSVYPIDN